MLCARQFNCCNLQQSRKGRNLVAVAPALGIAADCRRRAETVSYTILPQSSTCMPAFASIASDARDTASGQAVTVEANTEKHSICLPASIPSRESSPYPCAHASLPNEARRPDETVNSEKSYDSEYSLTRRIRQEVAACPHNARHAGDLLVRRRGEGGWVLSCHSQTSTIIVMTRRGARAS